MTQLRFPWRKKTDEGSSWWNAAARPEAAVAALVSTKGGRYDPWDLGRVGPGGRWDLGRL
jgi:hypothetical protein